MQETIQKWKAYFRLGSRKSKRVVKVLPSDPSASPFSFRSGRTRWSLFRKDMTREPASAGASATSSRRSSIPESNHSGSTRVSFSGSIPSAVTLHSPTTVKLSKDDHFAAPPSRQDLRTLFHEHHVANLFCADCDAIFPSHVNLSIGAFLCETCAKVHRHHAFLFDPSAGGVHRIPSSAVEEARSRYDQEEEEMFTEAVVGTLLRTGNATLHRYFSNPNVSNATDAVIATPQREPRRLPTSWKLLSKQRSTVCPKEEEEEEQQEREREICFRRKYTKPYRQRQMLAAYHVEHYQTETR